MVVEDLRGWGRYPTGAMTSVRSEGSLSWTVSRQAEGWYWGKVPTRVTGWYKRTASTVIAEATWPVLELHSSDSHMEGHDVELVLDA
jgi:hypothetical protein